MTDITELAQSLKAAAEKSTPGEWVVQLGDEVYATDDGVDFEQVAIATHDARDADFIALANPDNVKRLVEALEKAQRANGHLREQSAEWERKAISNFEDCAEMSARIEELESQRKFAFTACNRWADKFREAEKRYADLDIESAVKDASILELKQQYQRLLESRTVTVKLPPKIERDDADGWFTYKGSRVGGGAAEWYNKALDDVSSALVSVVTVTPEDADGVREEGNQFLVVRHPGKVPVIKHPVGHLEDYLLQILKADPLATIDIVTHRYYGAGGQFVKDADEYLHEMGIKWEAE